MGFWVTESLGFSMRAPQNLGGGQWHLARMIILRVHCRPPPSVLRNFNGAGGGGRPNTAKII